MSEQREDRSITRHCLATIVQFARQHPRLKAFIRMQGNLVNSHLLDRFLYIRRYGDLHVHVSTKKYQKRLQERAKVSFERYRVKYGAKRCFVIGNGPSLNKLDMTKLKNEVTIGSNGLFMNYRNMGFHPTFYTVVNYLIVEQMGHEISSLEESIKIFPSFLRRYFKKVQGEVLYVDAHERYECSEDITQWASWRSTVTFFNLQIALTLGSPEVYLIGVDNSYHQPPDSREGNVVVQEHKDVNHFSPNYFTKGFRWQLADTALMTEVYKLAKDAFARNGRVIMNATRGGELEVFPRVQYDDLFDITNRDN
jgi:hypothetical protein